jgi:microcystin degradation protein MlrC
VLRDEILAGIREVLPVDGVLLGLHGAMALEHNDDGEGPLLTAVRELVGPDVPIVAPLDLHTNLSDEMMREADAFVGYKEYPHIDTPETGAQALQILLATIRGEIKPTMAHVKLPLIAPNSLWSRPGSRRSRRLSTARARWSASRASSPRPYWAAFPSPTSHTRASRR